MGFPSLGAEHLQGVLEGHRSNGHWPSVPVGINIGINKGVTPQDAARDYGIIAKTLAEYPDYFTVNVSSPNTPGLRALQKAEPLKRILGAVLEVVDCPVFVKYSPEMDLGDLDASVATAEEFGVFGFIATNTTVQRPINEPTKGGVSGLPLWPISRLFLQELIKRTDKPVIGVGGITFGE